MYQLIIGLALLLTPRLAHAITLLPPCTASGDCGISDVLGVGINFAEFLLGISGAIALGFFVWGGFQMVLAAGRSEWVKNGFTTLKNASIGLLIIFLSGVLVRFTSDALTGGKNPIHAVGDSCSGGLYVQIPVSSVNAVENVQCVTSCDDLVGKLGDRPEAKQYGCFATDDAGVSSCVRGICQGSSGYACCICANGGCKTSSK